MSQSRRDDDAHEIIVRFASSLPDLPLHLSDPQHTTVLSLKLLVRKHLPSESSACRLNLIYAGRLLHNHDTVAAALNLKYRRRIPPPPPTVKGKEPLRPVQKWQPLYLQCSLGEPLTPHELENEVTNAAAAEHALVNSLSTEAPYSPTGTRDHSSPTRAAATENTAAEATSLLPPPPQLLGFDRLLGSGWTQDDVVSLRASFLAHLSYSHTPATMPAGDALRRLEERWLDSTGPGGSTSNDGGGSRGGNGADASALLSGADEADDAFVHFDDDEAGALNDGLWGSMVGFFWPWAAVWRFREPGVWSERQQTMILLGVTINVFFGFMRMVTSREESF